VKVFLKGPSGGGKTYLAAQATHLWRTLYIDVEGGLFSAFKAIKKENIEVRLVREPDPKDFFEKLGDAVCEAESGKYECVVVDSLTEIAGRMEDDYAAKSSTGKVEFGSWYELQERLRRMCRRLKDLNCNVIVTNLTKPVGDKAETQFEPVFPGQSATVIPSFFDTTGLVRKMTGKTSSNYVLTTDGPAIYQVRDRYGALQAEETIDEKSPLKIWKKLQDGISSMSGAGKEAKEPQTTKK
jgi:hypothetical protein